MVIFRPILDLIGAIFYLFYKLGVVLVEVVKIILGLGRLLVGLVVGLFKTLTGLSYTGTPSTIPGAYSEAYSRLQPVMDRLQLDKLAYIILVAIWIFTAIAAIRLIGSMRGGGSSA